jgi:hypothetical protein
MRVTSAPIAAFHLNRLQLPFLTQPGANGGLGLWDMVLVICIPAANLNERLRLRNSVAADIPHILKNPIGKLSAMLLSNGFT